MTTQPLILIVDDDQPHRSMLRTVLRGWGYGVEEADDGTTAVALVRERAFDAVLTDVRMAHMDGITTLSQIRAWNPAIPVLIMTAWSSVESAVDALRLGAYDYLTKPLDFDVLRLSLERALDHTRLATENQELRRRLTNQESPILGRSRPVRELVEMVETVAPTEATVLITGESGTGKELVARAIQSASLRKDKPFVTINCAALAENLLESELFGHEAGAFTGARGRRIGFFERADGGTLLLDVVADMPLPLQDRLLRVIEYGGFDRVGGVSSVRVDVRVVAATNRDLPRLAAEGRFRPDLLDRLAFDVAHVPPLRIRGEDKVLLARHFAARMAVELGRDVAFPAGPQFGGEALRQLEQYAWPGNVRELKNVVERSVARRRTLHLDALDMDPFALPFNASSCSRAFEGEGEQGEATPEHSWRVGPLEPGFRLPDAVAELERAALRKALEQARFRQHDAAFLLGLTYHQFRALYRKYRNDL